MLTKDWKIIVDPKTALLSPVDYRPSPHCDDRPADASIDALIIHNISLPPGEFGGTQVIEFFCGTLETSGVSALQCAHGLKVSAHLFIRRDGSIVQFVPFHRRAWHAGVSSLEGKPNCNDFSIGIELEGTDTLPYEEIQYVTLTNVTRLLMRTYPAIQPHRIVGHADVAPLRKTDPGASFQWNYFRGLLL